MDMLSEAVPRPTVTGATSSRDQSGSYFYRTGPYPVRGGPAPVGGGSRGRREAVGDPGLLRADQGGKSKGLANSKIYGYSSPDAV